MAQASELQLEVDSLRSQKRISEEQLMHATNERSNQVSSLVKQVEFLQQQFHFISSQKSELESQLKNKSQEASQCCIQIEKTKIN